MCVLKGRMVLLHDGPDVEVKAGETVFIARGERFRPTFPDGKTELSVPSVRMLSPFRVELILHYLGSKDAN